MSDFKPELACKFYEEDVLNRILGEVTYMKHKPNIYPYKILIFDTPKFESDAYRHRVTLRIINNNKKVKLKLEDFFIIEDDKNLSLDIIQDFYKLLKPLIGEYNKLGNKQYSIKLDGGIIQVNLR